MNATTRKAIATRRRLGNIRPSPENEALYRPVREDDPEVLALAESIREFGMKEPIIITLDGWIISGHRRHVAARMAGLKMVPVRVEPIHRERDHDRFLRLLRECNRQRVKTREELAREEAVTIDPDAAYESLVEYRAKKSRVSVETIRLRGEKRRHGISKAKRPMLDAARAVLGEYREFWPLSVRQLHYYLLNDPPLRHASKPKSRYRNDRPSYQDLDDILVRARLDGTVPMCAIADETRPVVTWQVHGGIQTFVRQELDEFLKGYWRDLMQSQPNHVEILGEKLTLQSIIRPVAADYCIPYTLGRGYANLPVRAAIVERWRDSGKDKLVLLISSDLDPDGREIGHSFVRSLRDDFDVPEEDIVPVQVAITPEQVAEYDLPCEMSAKATSSNYRRFVEEHGEHAYELEALRPEQLQEVLRDAIDAVIDTEAFNAEAEEEKSDAHFLARLRQRVVGIMGDIDAELGGE